MDNLVELYQEKFKLVYGSHFPGGSWFFCRKCGAKAHSMECWFPCKQDFVPTKVICMECGNHWRLKIEVSCESKELETSSRDVGTHLDS